MCRVAVHALLFSLAVASRNHGTDVIFTNEPCDAFSQGAKFRPVDGDPTRYKQCGPVGYFWVLPCASGTIFSMTHRSCVQPDLIPATTTTQTVITTTIPPPTLTATTTISMTAPGLVVFPLQNITNAPSAGAPVVSNITGLSPRLLSEFEEAMVDFMMKKEQLVSTTASTTTHPPISSGQSSIPATSIDGHQQSTLRPTVQQPLAPLVEPLPVSTTIHQQSPLLPIGDSGSSKVAQYGFTIVDDRSPLIDNPASSFLPGLAPSPIAERVLPVQNIYDTMPPPQLSIDEFIFTTELPPSTLAPSIVDVKSSFVTPLDDRPLYPLIATAAPQTKVRLFRGCEIGAACPFGSEANELFCYHPTDSHGYLHCSPDRDKQGEWVERFCPDTLVFMGDRCENALTSTDLQTSPPRFIHQVTMPPFTVSAPPHQWQPEAPLHTRPPTIAPHAANGWTLHPPAASTKRPLFPRIHPFDLPDGVMPRVRPPPPPQLLPEPPRPLPPPVMPAPHTIDSAAAAIAQNELLLTIEAMRSFGAGGQLPHSQQQIVSPITDEQMELAQRELIEKFQAVERLESQGRHFPGFPPSDLQTLPPVATFSQDLEPLARRIAEYLAAQHPTVLAALLKSPGTFTAALESPWAKQLPGYLPKLADAALTKFTRMKMVPLPDDKSAESDDPKADSICSKLQEVRADSKEPSAFFMCVTAPSNSNQARNEKKDGRWIRMLCPVNRVFKQADGICE